MKSGDFPYQIPRLMEATIQSVSESTCYSSHQGELPPPFEFMLCFWLFGPMKCGGSNVPWPPTLAIKKSHHFCSLIALRALSHQPDPQQRAGERARGKATKHEPPRRGKGERPQGGPLQHWTCSPAAVTTRLRLRAGPRRTDRGCHPSHSRESGNSETAAVLSHKDLRCLLFNRGYQDTSKGADRGPMDPKRQQDDWHTHLDTDTWPTGPYKPQGKRNPAWSMA